MLIFPKKNIYPAAGSRKNIGMGSLKTFGLLRVKSDAELQLVIYISGGGGILAEKNQLVTVNMSDIAAPMGVGGGDLQRTTPWIYLLKITTLAHKDSSLEMRKIVYPSHFNSLQVCIFKQFFSSQIGIWEIGNCSKILYQF